MRGFYSPIDKLASQLARGRGTGEEFMGELSKRPGYKQSEAEDRGLQALTALPKMAREDFMKALQAKAPVRPQEKVLQGNNAQHSEYTLPGGTNYREVLLSHPQGNYPGVPQHFDGAPNVLASMRVKDRKGPNGEKVLHIEEIQSDWHQKGNKKGYAPAGEDLHAKAKLARNKADMLIAAYREAKANSDAVERRIAASSDPVRNAADQKTMQFYNDQIMELSSKYMKASDESNELRHRALNAVPDAPFKKDWHELALKRMIQHAAEKGYHQIHVTPGKAQAERWSSDEDSGKGFFDLYDKKIPQFLNKFGRQYGSQVQPGVVDTHPVHRFDVTDKMREDVLKNGMPLYAKGGVVKETVTVSPDMDTMRYELIRAKKVK